jgi:hypothetical protein
MLRYSVLVLVAYPLLMPTGMCMCGTLREASDESQFCNGPCAVTVATSCFAAAKPHCGACSGRHSVPGGDRCPPNCPANQNTDHSKLVEPGFVMPVATLAVCLPRFDIGMSSGLPNGAAVFHLQPPSQPIYITLCALVI